MTFAKKRAVARQATTVLPATTDTLNMSSQSRRDEVGLREKCDDPAAPLGAQRSSSRQREAKV